MNALYLKDLADKTRRGLEGRVRAGRSGGGLCYGYDVVPGEERGGRAINEDEAAVVRRIFAEFAAGRSPRAIARRLNDDGIRGPRGILWRDTAIRGHRQRGTGILNNELYIGRLVWNRQRYVKDPASGRRVSRINPAEALIVEDVPELRIVEDTLWEAVKARQAKLDADPAVQAIKASRFWERRRPVHMLTGRAFCGACGGTLAAAGRDYLACSNARKLGTCSERKAIRRPVLEDVVLGPLRDRLMQPDAVNAFVAAYHAEIASGRGAAAVDRKRKERDLTARRFKLDGYHDAVAEGLRTPGLLAKIEALEAEVAELEAALAAEPPASLVCLHPKLGDIYREKVMALRVALANPLVRDEAVGHIRELVAQVEVTDEMGGPKVELHGAITTLMALDPEASAFRPGAAHQPPVGREDQAPGRLCLSGSWAALPAPSPRQKRHPFMMRASTSSVDLRREPAT
jgi:site-specific DNA recombinase